MKSKIYFTQPRLITKYIYLVILLLSSYLVKAQTLIVNGTSWAVPILSITEAGSDYSGPYQSAVNQVLLTASIPVLLGSAKVSVHYQANPTWNNSLLLSTRRTGNGTTVCLLCSITGGTNYQTLTLTDVELFRITAVAALAAYSNIPIQLQLSGVSVTIPAAAYNSRAVFTISAL